MKTIAAIMIISFLLLAGCTQQPASTAFEDDRTDTQALEEEREEMLERPPENPGSIDEATYASHDGEASCWVVFEGEVYDVTDYLDKHPGGVEEILPHCGRNSFEDAFVEQHGRSKVAKLMEEAPKQGTYTG